jgi:hypothetical protein
MLSIQVNRDIIDKNDFIGNITYDVIVLNLLYDGPESMISITHDIIS